MSKKYNVAIIGYGWAATAHIAAIAAINAINAINASAQVYFSFFETVSALKH